ncbi:MAG: MFS transporter [Spirochaetota bacterium]|nr:MFS transporter [Spirochaetota bacterium]
MIHNNKIQVKKSKLRQTLKASFLDGIFASIMFGCVQDYFTPFLLLIKGTVVHVGILSAIPNITASVLQVFSHKFVQIFKSRKTVFCIFVFLQAVTLLLCAILFFTVYAIETDIVSYCLSLVKHHQIEIFITIVTLYTVFGSIGNPAWASLMSDLIPAHKRGKYFGFRNSILGVLLVLVSLSVGITLRFSPAEYIMQTFVVVFLIASVSRFISFYYLLKMHEPPFEIEKASIVPANIFNSIKKNDFLIFIAFMSFMNFAVYLSAPFFAVLMLQHLSFSYFEYSLVTVSAPFIMYIAMHSWGNIADKIGNAKVLTITSPLIAIVPILWVLNSHIVYLLIVQIFSGLVWSGFTISSFNYMFDASVSSKRVRYISYLNLINGIMISAGAVSGGYLIQILPPVNGSSIYTMLLVSGILRLGITIVFGKRLKEMRLVKI